MENTQFDTERKGGGNGGRSKYIPSGLGILEYHTDINLYSRNFPTNSILLRTSVGLITGMLFSSNTVCLFVVFVYTCVSSSTLLYRSSTVVVGSSP